MFVKKHYRDADVQAKAPKERFKLIALKWRKYKAEQGL